MGVFRIFRLPWIFGQLDNRSELFRVIRRHSGGRFPWTCIGTSCDLGSSTLETYYLNFISRQL